MNSIICEKEFIGFTQNVFAPFLHSTIYLAVVIAYACIRDKHLTHHERGIMAFGFIALFLYSKTVIGSFILGYTGSSDCSFTHGLSIIAWFHSLFSLGFALILFSKRVESVSIWLIGYLACLIGFWILYCIVAVLIVNYGEKFLFILF
jgi:hypothetical protein